MQVRSGAHRVEAIGIQARNPGHGLGACHWGARVHYLARAHGLRARARLRAAATHVCCRNGSVAGRHVHGWRSDSSGAPPCVKTAGWCTGAAVVGANTAANAAARHVPSPPRTRRHHLPCEHRALAASLHRTDMQTGPPSPCAWARDRVPSEPSVRDFDWRSSLEDAAEADHATTADDAELRRVQAQIDRAGGFGYGKYGML